MSWNYCLSNYVHSPFNGTVAYGLRALASTALNEHGFDPDLIETALAHIDRNARRRAHNRAEYVEQRREMMEWWSNQIIDAANLNASLAQ